MKTGLMHTDLLPFPLSFFLFLFLTFDHETPLLSHFCVKSSPLTFRFLKNTCSQWQRINTKTSDLDGFPTTLLCVPWTVSFRSKAKGYVCYYIIVIYTTIFMEMRCIMYLYRTKSGIYLSSHKIYSLSIHRMTEVFDY